LEKHRVLFVWRSSQRLGEVLLLMINAEAAGLHTSDDVLSTGNAIIRDRLAKPLASPIPPKYAELSDHE
jgi:hypothetical protein